MEEKNYELMISQYIDNELNKNDVDKLLEHITSCTECQELLNKYNRLKNSVSDFYSSIDKYTVSSAIIQRRKSHNIISFAIAAVVVFITFIVFSLVTPVGNKRVDTKKGEYNTLQMFNNNSWIRQISDIQNSVDNLEKEIKAKQL